MNGLVALAQFAAIEVIDVRPERDCSSVSPAAARCV